MGFCLPWLPVVPSLIHGLFVIILHSPPKGGAQLSYPSRPTTSGHGIFEPNSPELPRSSVGGGQKATNPPTSLLGKVVPPTSRYSNGGHKATNPPSSPPKTQKHNKKQSKTKENRKVHSCPAGSSNHIGAIKTATLPPLLHS